MAKKDDKKKVIKKLAAKGSKSGRGNVRNMAKYLKFGDLSPSAIHTGNTTYRGMTLFDSPSTNRLMFGGGVYAEGGYKGFQFQNKVYRFTSPDSSSAHKEVKV